LLKQAPVAQRVAAAGGLDLDDVGAEVAEGLADERSGDELPHLQDPKAVECAGSEAGKVLRCHEVLPSGMPVQRGRGSRCRRARGSAKRTMPAAASVAPAMTTSAGVVLPVASLM